MRYLFLTLLLLTGCASIDNSQQWERVCYAIATPPYEKCIDKPVERLPREPREPRGRNRYE